MKILAKLHDLQRQQCKDHQDSIRVGQRAEHCCVRFFILRFSRLRRALDEYRITGIRTNVGLFRRILAEPEFLRGEIHTKWLDELLTRPRPPAPPPRPGTEEAAVIAAALWHMEQVNRSAKHEGEAQAAPSPWKRQGRHEQVDRRP